MKLLATNRFPFSRQPLSTLSKITIVALLSLAGSEGMIWIFSTLHNPGLLVLLFFQVLCAGLLTITLRWIPLLGALMGGVALFLFTRQPYVIEHLTRPKAGVFAFFVLILIALASAVIVFGAGMSAMIQNYLTREQQAPRWWWAMLSGIAGMVIGAILITVIA